MKQKSVMIFIIAACVLVLPLFYFQVLSKSKGQPKVLPEPDKLAIYKNGNRLTVEKNNPIFDKIVELSNKRLNSNISIVQLIIDKQMIDNVKKDILTLEFIYSNEQTFIKQHNTGNVEFKYTNIIFPLVTKSEVYANDYMFSEYNGKYTMGPLGKLSDPNELVNIVNGVIE